VCQRRDSTFFAPGNVPLTECSFAGISYDERRNGVYEIAGAKAGTEGAAVAALSMEEAGVYGWFLEAAAGGDFDKACDAFRTAAGIVDRLVGI